MATLREHWDFINFCNIPSAVYLAISLKHNYKIDVQYVYIFSATLRELIISWNLARRRALAHRQQSWSEKPGAENTGPATVFSISALHTNFPCCFFW
jgi:hypothetical protein